MVPSDQLGFEEDLGGPGVNEAARSALPGFQRDAHDNKACDRRADGYLNLSVATVTTCPSGMV